VKSAGIPRDGKLTKQKRRRQGQGGRRARNGEECRAAQKNKKNSTVVATRA
jgi:hypothetical protein